MANLVTIYGGSGFVGRYIARRLAAKGWRVRVAVRRPNEAIFVKTYGAPGQVEPVLCNIRDDASVRAAMAGAAAVVNCVGTFDARGKNNFDAVQAQGAGRIARIAAEENVARMVHLSAIGADASSQSIYARSKAAGEAAVLAAMPNAMILRPSVIFGAEDQFFNRFASMASLSPMIPVVGAETRFQPVHVDDVAQAAVAGVEGAATGVFELGGPDVASFGALMKQMLTVIERRRLILNLPFPIARLVAGMSDLVARMSLGLVPAQITPDQVRSLTRDNIVTEGTKGFADLGIVPSSMQAILPTYLWRFRASGQYADIKRSAKNLRAH